MINARLPYTRWRVGLTFLLALPALTIGLWTPAQAAPWATPPAPATAGSLATPETPGTIYYGATPAGGGTSKPVLLFVHGKSGQASDWWTDTRYHGHNDMYDYAYNYGYRTAFVDVDGAGSMWTNGQTLRGEIDSIAAHYGVSSLNVVAHSKGGIDSQAAIVHYGAAPRVQKLFTLSTPHWGSPTADLAYSSWTWWIAAILGERNDAAYSLQTGYMSWFRSITDPRPENNNTRYYTSAGTSWGPTFSALWFGGSYLSFYGSNDGLVPVTYAYNPRATHVFTRNLDHDSIRIGSNVFPTVDTYVNSLWRTGAETPTDSPMDAQNPATQVTGSNILRGGPIPAAGSAPTTVRDSILIEPAAQQVTLDLLSNTPDLALSWTAPNGQTYGAKPAATQDEMFNGAYHYAVTVAAPAAGNWQMRATHAGKDAAAYLLVAAVQSPLTVQLTRDPALTFAPGSALPIQVRVSDAQGRTVTALQVSGDVTLDGAGTPSHFTAQATGNGLAQRLTLPNATGVANLSLTVTGRLADGSRFERQIATSVPVVAKGAQLSTR
ncbi:MAG: hypothetical protein M3Z04_18220 [Chloroflexota bacterium]|nr:hypothetical protein [Chloroflexota bacterium]